MDTLPGDKKDAKVTQSTISRFACRILVDRNEPAKARIFAAGFDTSRNIFLGVSFLLHFCRLSKFICHNDDDCGILITIFHISDTGKSYKMARQC